MNIGLIDVDGHNFPSLPLMKISSYYKKLGHQVSWYSGAHCDRVYMAKVFSFTPDYTEPIDADEIFRGGTGYAISLVNGKEVYDQSKDPPLPEEIEHSFPDYSLYHITDTAYGFLTRGCPRGCGFCHVAPKEGRCSRKVADLREFWDGQPNIKLLDPNMFACADWRDLSQQLIDSHAWIDFTQGVDIRVMTAEKASMIRQMKIAHVHFAFDRYQDKDIIMPKLATFRNVTGWTRKKMSCYVLCNFDTNMMQNMERVLYLRSLNINPYVMLYDKQHLPRGDIHWRFARWCNSKIFFWKYPSFEEFQKALGYKEILSVGV